MKRIIKSERICDLYISYRYIYRINHCTTNSLNWLFNKHVCKATVLTSDAHARNESSKCSTKNSHNRGDITE